MAELNGNTDGYTSYKTSSNGKVMYLEPNHFTQYNLNNQDNNVETSVYLEDLNIYCELLVEKYSPTSINSIETYSQVFKMNLDGSSNSRLYRVLRGSKYDTDGGSFMFTTDYADKNYNSLKNDIDVSDMIGVNSIKISYDNWQCPTVDIVFTDIRGMSFGAEEKKHNSTNISNGMTGLIGGNDTNIEDGFFSSFFKFPYPRFLLFIKGFYGEPIIYDLAVDNFSCSLDSNTGNFNINVKFIGYRFGILNDINMASVVAAVNTSKGKEYWNNNFSNLTSLTKILKEYKSYETKVQEYDKQLEKNTEEFNNNLAQSIPEYFNRYVSAVKSFGNAMVNYNKNKIYSKRIESIKNEGVINYEDLSNYQKEKISNLSELSLIGIRSLSYGKKYEFILTDNAYTKTVNHTNKAKLDTKIPCAKYFSYNIDNFFKEASNNTTKFYSSVLQEYNNSEITEKTITPFKNNTIVSSINLNFGSNCKKETDNKKQYESWKLENIDDIDLNGKTLKIIHDEFLAFIDKSIKDYKKDREILEKLNTLKNLIDTNGELDILNKKPNLSTTNYHFFITYGTQKNKNKIDFKTERVFVSLPTESSLLKESHNVLCELPRFMYTFDFSKGYEISNWFASKSQSFSEKIAKEKENAHMEIAQKTFTFNTDIQSITETIWAHLQTFLNLCRETNINIIDSKRTAEDLRLGKTNSNLPLKYYETDCKEIVPPFPTVFKMKQEDGQDKKTLTYLKDITSSEKAYENDLVDDMLLGAATIGSEENTTGNIETYNALEFGYYQYLQKLFNKWAYYFSYNNEEDFKKIWGLETYYKKHFLFIDTTYNLLGKVSVDTIKFAEYCEKIFTDIDNNTTVMSFISKYLQDINAIMVSTQGFMLNNIENNEDTIAYYKKIFTPIPFSEMKTPEIAPYFIVIYRGKPSEHLDFNDENNNDDSYLISNVVLSTDNNTKEILPNGFYSELKNSNEETVGYPVPAIGVSYGKQYQNYFINVSVDNHRPIANEVSLAAEYQICGVDINGKNSGTDGRLPFGQDLFTVYANNSYTCKVDMLGCMWIQPLMYFQLNNVPMFRGTYMIQNVTHNITPGNMITTFTGVRMSRYAMPTVDKIGLLISRQEEQVKLQNIKASWNNDCPYKIFDPFEEFGSGNGAFNNKWLNDKFGTHFSGATAYKLPDSAYKTWFEVAKTKETYKALASVIVLENSRDDLSIQLHATVLYNSFYASNLARENKLPQGVNKSDISMCLFQGQRWVSCMSGVKNGHVSQLIEYLNTGYINSRGITRDKCKRIEDIVKETFINSPSIYKGKNPLYLKIEDLASMFYTGSSEKNLICSYNGSNYYYYKAGNKIPFWTNNTTNQNTSDTDKITPKKFGEALLNSIKQTYNMYEGLSGATFDDDFTATVINNANTRIVFNIKEKHRTPLNIAYPLLLDIIYNEYDSYESFKSGTSPGVLVFYKTSSKNYSDYNNISNFIIFCAQAKKRNESDSKTKIAFVIYEGNTVKGNRSNHEVLGGKNKVNIIYGDKYFNAFEINSSIIPEEFIKVLAKKYKKQETDKTKFFDFYIKNPCTNDLSKLIRNK